MKILSGSPEPLGATYYPAGTHPDTPLEGTNFALFSQHSERVELCLFDSAGQERETNRILLPEWTGHVWHAFVPGVQPGQLYGYRVHGRYEPEHGYRFNPKKLLLDPYAKAVTRLEKANHTALFGADWETDDKPNPTDSAPYAPLGLVTHLENPFDWQGTTRPNTAWHQTIVYEAHVKGMTYSHPAVPKEHRGKYLGMCSKPILDHLLALGIRSVELLPVHQHLSEKFLEEQGKTNYWGYNTLNFFTPDSRYAVDPKNVMTEFKTMVREFHKVGLEVILDVVYNHTAEGNHLGHTLSFRGIDNIAYYYLFQNNKRFYENYTGCGNALDLRHPYTLKLVMDSLRYWATEYQIDGFRFDLATTLARDANGFNSRGGFFQAVHQDPVLSQVKLISEPWDAGLGGYRLGHYPVRWSEWNDKFRDCVRSFWNGFGTYWSASLGDMATRLTGSSDYFQLSGREPQASLNFVTCHDGFCLEDLVSYNNKHNDANGENNRDGSSHNHSWNCGEEGVTKKKNIVALRYQQKRNFMATLMLSLGTPMMLAGDELSHTQMGNNNAYCQDSEISWLNWDLESDEEKKAFLNFTRNVIQVRNAHPTFQRKEFLQGLHPELLFFEQEDLCFDVAWLRADGLGMEQRNWHDQSQKAMGVVLDGNTISLMDAEGNLIKDDMLLLLLNRSATTVPFTLPKKPVYCAAPIPLWQVVLDTTLPEGIPETNIIVHSETEYALPPRSMVLFKQTWE